ncbi:uncharacterized protein UV8b_05415 [Ustilaginoidea virens]|uniref:Uncharacterized protein n=1 Tax=Ustilaginoidea virens TaxID=1159556 RepID=A0A8E5MJ21_USTVR|nr:uncharacterized protein UV8b_05415 [Ustilaginoidea virens]QUC21172.1 hypothetical protein UV8b_05415 [Ustilaginoidea virens]
MTQVSPSFDKQICTVHIITDRAPFCPHGAIDAGLIRLFQNDFKLRIKTSVSIPRQDSIEPCAPRSASVQMARPGKGQ